MKKFYIASICRGGILGGGIFADDEGITFRTGKVTVPAALRNLEMKYGDIRDFSEKRVLFFPHFQPKILPVFTERKGEEVNRARRSSHGRGCRL